MLGALGSLAGTYALPALATAFFGPVGLVGGALLKGAGAGLGRGLGETLGGVGAEDVSEGSTGFLAKDFSLDHNITISITDVYLYISYIQPSSDFLSEPWIFIKLLLVMSAKAVYLGGHFIAY